MSKFDCHVCDDEGFTDGNQDLSERAPWSFWAGLKPPSDLAVRLGMVKRVPCYECVVEEDVTP